MSDDISRLERGDRVRREVLGDAHVHRSRAQATDFTRVVQEYVTASCWGDVWSRPGLDRRTRSLLNLAMLTALNRPHEFSVHVRGALRNGCTVAEIQEVLLQTAAYCGAPAALESFRLAERVILEVQQEQAAATTAGTSAATTAGTVAG
ncbi:carboxymuconolactone decarboxylase family protein [Dactylosporangium sp. NPDC051541]|uniref:carboxymuconolactone decarboxylase family protein n=1 Tax=Dactylosporangium sp. NPDC051541 TaxID=3363977 RepID=UPI0037B0CC95